MKPCRLFNSLVSFGTLFLLFVGSVKSFSTNKQPSSKVSRFSPITTTPNQQQYPTYETPPFEILEAHLGAMHEGEWSSIYHLFSRARKLEIDNAARKDSRESVPSPSRREQALEAYFSSRQSEPLLEHTGNYNILSFIGDPNPPKGRLPTRLARVKVDSAYFIFTLTRQSDWDGKGDPRDCDGYEKCWFVWDIQRDGNGGSDKDDDDPVRSPGGGTAKQLIVSA